MKAKVWRWRISKAVAIIPSIVIGPIIGPIRVLSGSDTQEISQKARIITGNTPIKALSVTLRLSRINVIFMIF